MLSSRVSILGICGDISERSGLEWAEVELQNLDPTTLYKAPQPLILKNQTCNPTTLNPKP